MNITSAGKFFKCWKGLKVEIQVKMQSHAKIWGYVLCIFFLGGLLIVHVFLLFWIQFFVFTAGIISLLDEPMPELKVFALKKLDSIVDEFWPEISEAIEKM